MPRINTYTAAELCGAADNIAAGHGQLPAGCDIHTAATIYCAACLVQHPQFAIRHEFVREITRIAVLDSQLPAVLDHNHAAIVCALVFEHMTVQVQRHGAVDGQGTADVNVRRQLDGVDISIGNRRSQLRLVADLFLPSRSLQSTPSRLSPAGGRTLPPPAALPHRLRAGRTLHSSPAKRPLRRRWDNLRSLLLPCRLFHRCIQAVLPSRSRQMPWSAQDRAPCTEQAGY